MADYLVRRVDDGSNKQRHGLHRQTWTVSSMGCSVHSGLVYLPCCIFAPNDLLTTSRRADVRLPILSVEDAVKLDRVLSGSA